MTARQRLAGLRRACAHNTYWLITALVLALVLVAAARLLIAKTTSLTGTNSVDVATIAATAKANETVCVEDLIVPKGTARIGLAAMTNSASARGRLEVVFRSAETGLLTPLSGPLPTGALNYAPYALPRILNADTAGSLCVTPIGARVSFGGAFVQQRGSARSTSIDGVPLTPADVSLRYLLPEGDSPRLIAQVARALERASVFEPRIGAALLAISVPTLVLLVALSLWIGARAETFSIRRLAYAACAVAFVHAAMWAVLLHPFHGADESEHFAYAQYLASTNQEPDRSAVSNRSPYSSQQIELMAALHHNSTILNTTSRPRWQQAWESRYRNSSRMVKPEVDGGGGSESATGHSPLYYAIIGVPYRLTGWIPYLPSRLLVMRLFNAAFASLIAGIAVLTAARVFRGRSNAACWAAGLLVAFQPVGASVAASINNDTGVNLLAATLCLLFLGLMTNGPSKTTAIAIGATSVVLPVMKVTGFAPLAVLPLVVLISARRHGVGPLLRWSALALITGAVVAAAWIHVASPLIGGDRGLIYNAHPTVAPPPASPPAQALRLSTRLDYFRQTFVPSFVADTPYWQLPGQSSLDRWPAYFIYINRGYGLFGWKSVDVGPNLLLGIFAFLTVGWMLALLSAYKHIRAGGKGIGDGLVLAGIVLSVLLLISYAYTNPVAHTDAGEQGRYLFTALVPLSVLFASGVFTFRPAYRVAAAGSMSAAAGGVALLCWLSALTGWYT
ncbi:MAG: DUF2142 domain-containing protein [Solirubrobacterales bacterium]|nr:DUF2142 domain-containing protein [Solirubrobacterales bacterium]